jgi:hypothetical protein
MIDDFVGGGNKLFAVTGKLELFGVSPTVK